MVTLGAIGSIAAVAVVAGFASGAFSSPSPVAASAPSHPDSWDPALEPYIEFIERERGLEFDHPVSLRYADIAAEVAADFEEQREFDEEWAAENDDVDYFDPYGEAWRLLGLVDFEAEASSAESTEQSIIENAGAFYDPWFEEIVLPEGASETSLQLTIVHELTHALQDQNGMLDTHLDSTDSAQSRLALIEGDAERIAEAWFHQMSPTEQDDYLDSIGYDPNESYEDPPNSYLDANFFVSYSLGVPLVLTIIETEGEEAFNELLRSRDVGTTERFIDVLGGSNWSSSNVLAEFEPPPGRGRSDGDLGALAWFATLAPSVGTERAFDAMIGYDDDAFAIYDDEGSGQTCGRFQLFFDDSIEAQEFFDVATSGGVIGDLDLAGSSFSADICEPVGDAFDQNNAVMFPVILSNELVLFHLLSGLDQSVTRCAAIAQAQTIPVDRPLDDFAGYDALFADAASFASACQ